MIWFWVGYAIMAVIWTAVADTFIERDMPSDDPGDRVANWVMAAMVGLCWPMSAVIAVMVGLASLLRSWIRDKLNQTGGKT